MNNDFTACVGNQYYTGLHQYTSTGYPSFESAPRQAEYKRSGLHIIDIRVCSAKHLAVSMGGTCRYDRIKPRMLLSSALLNRGSHCTGFHQYTGLSQNIGLHQYNGLHPHTGSHQHTGLHQYAGVHTSVHWITRYILDSIRSLDCISLLDCIGTGMEISQYR